MDNLLIAIQITIISMTLVFGAILLLWALMAALVRLTAEREDAAETPAPDSAETTAIAPGDSAPDDLELKSRAAAIAVTVALAEASNRRPPALRQPPPTAGVSPWQATMRANQLRQKRARR